VILFHTAFLILDTTQFLLMAFSSPFSDSNFLKDCSLFLGKAKNMMGFNFIQEILGNCTTDR